MRALLLFAFLAILPQAPTASTRAFLPDVLMIGDSISWGYLPTVVLDLDGIAAVERIYYPTDSGLPSAGQPQIPLEGTRTAVENDFEALDRWLGSVDWHVIHFNFGLHDLRLVDGMRQVDLLAYEENLDAIVAYLRDARPNATLVFATTTPVPSGVENRIEGDEIAYNDVAIALMQANGVLINDLHATIGPSQAYYVAPGNVHFNAAGSELLGHQVADAIVIGLPEPYAPIAFLVAIASSSGAIAFARARRSDR